MRQLLEQEFYHSTFNLYSPLLCKGETTAGVLCAVLCTIFLEEYGHVRRDSEKGKKMMQGVEDVPYNDSMRKLEMFGLEEIRPRRGVPPVFRFISVS